MFPACMEMVIDNISLNNQVEIFKRKMLIVTSVTLILPPVTGIFLLSFVGVFPYPEVFYPFTDYAAVVVLVSCGIGFWLNNRFIGSIVKLLKSRKSSDYYKKHLRRLPIYYFSVLFLYFAVGLNATLFSLSTFHGFNYGFEKYLISFLGIIPGGLVTALPIFFYLTDALGKFLAPHHIPISVAPIKLKLVVLGLFIPIFIDTLLIMYFYNRTGYLEFDTIFIWLFLIVIAAVGTLMAWQSFKQSLSPFVNALELDNDRYTNVDIIAQSLDELGILSNRWRDLWQRVLEYEKRLSDSNTSLKNDIQQRTQQLENERLFIDSALEKAGALLVVLDRNGRIVRFNTACEKLTGFSFSELQNSPIWEWLIPPEQVKAVRQTFNNLTNNEGDSSYENDLMTKNGERVLVAWTNSTIKDDEGFVKYTISIGIDISERQKKEQDLEEARKIAETSSRAKSEFLSRMSHELRTPMNAILGFGQLLEMGNDNLTKDQKASVDEIINGGHHLLALINDVLDLAKIEQGKFEVQLKDIILTEVIEEVISMMMYLAKEKNISIHYDFVNMRDILVSADRLRLKQVIINLLSNAIKFNRFEGEIFIDIQLRDNNLIKVGVRDTGYGILEEELNKLFMPFERLNSAGSHFADGTGIGLALSKHLMHFMNGDISVGDVSDNGCTFYIEMPYAGNSESIPLANINNSVLNTTDDTLLSPKNTVLYVEDNSANLRLISRAISRRDDILFISAEDGVSGLEMVSKHFPDLVLLDINLPGIDGLEVIKQIRLNDDIAHIPVVAVTANALPSDIQIYNDAGFDEILIKPLDINQFFNVLECFLPEK